MSEHQSDHDALHDLISVIEGEGWSVTQYLTSLGGAQKTVLKVEYEDSDYKNE